VLATLGVGEQGPWRVARIGFTAADELAAVADPQMRRVLMETLRGRGIEAPVLPWRKGFIALLDAAASLQLQAPGMLARLRRVLTKATASTRDLQFAVGVGREESSPDRLGWSLETAEQALLAAQRLGTGEQVMFAEELGVYRLLLGGNRREDYQDFMVQTLGALLDPPHQRLLETLETLTRCEFSLRLTARQLGVHENTVKYRLRRITEMVGGDPARGEHRLEIELALKIRHLRMR
jgi:sugar diacid utilization regulator